jgi:hypothetical protein
MLDICLHIFKWQLLGCSALARVAELVDVRYRWRPQLSDAGDELVPATN